MNTPGSASLRQVVVAQSSWDVCVRKQADSCETDLGPLRSPADAGRDGGSISAEVARFVRTHAIETWGQVAVLNSALPPRSDCGGDGSVEERRELPRCSHGSPMKKPYGRPAASKLDVRRGANHRGATRTFPQ
jgi:hypothetical protein